MSKANNNQPKPKNQETILEVAILSIKKGLSKDFERSFEKAQNIISSMKGYVSHDLKKCIEQEGKYILLVNW
ncbi:antibiotic biosynthesis monooxygenase family protein [Flavivirga aquatica]|uniref:antibiotic biosynthesis monooxygenase family protein n=1 Tax=Flavivirga aquatica TaxID=1849968 RepID=UPI001F0AC918|nr:antibiotic biosynthesis monooxygenase [Flavivirga aquatica]